jgi:hypothetical protein
MEAIGNCDSGIAIALIVIVIVQCATCKRNLVILPKARIECQDARALRHFGNGIGVMKIRHSTNDRLINKLSVYSELDANRQRSTHRSKD